VKLWDTATGKCIATLTGFEGSVNAVAFSPEGKRIATLRVGRFVSVYSLAFSPGGKTLASGGRTRGVITLWDMPTSKKAKN